MARIAAHHKPGHPLAKETDYILTQDWPDDCHVQWGGRGVVLSKDGAYGTAFFEAFPSDNAGGFIRGEGTTIEEAEKKAFTRWQKEVSCAHAWGRRGYTNGGAVCVKCKAFTTGIFKPIHDLAAWKAPLDCTELMMITEGNLRGADWVKVSAEARAASAKYRRRIELRARVAGIRLPPTPEPEKVMPDLDAEDPYADACTEACLVYYAKERERLRKADTDQSLIAQFFRAFEIAGLDREARKRGLIPAEDDQGSSGK